MKSFWFVIYQVIFILKFRTTSGSRVKILSTHDQLIRKSIRFTCRQRQVFILSDSLLCIQNKGGSLTHFIPAHLRPQMCPMVYDQLLPTKSDLHPPFGYAIPFPINTVNAPSKNENTKEKRETKQSVKLKFKSIPSH